MAVRVLLALAAAMLVAAGCGSSGPAVPTAASLPASGLRATDLAPRLGLAGTRPVHTWSAGVADFNGDSRPDIFLVRHLIEPGSIFANTGRRFREVARGTLARTDRHFCTFADVDRDGRVDAFCSVGADRGTAVKADQLLLQESPGRFRDRAAAYGVVDPYGRGRYATFLDVNKDSWPDLFVGNAAPRADDHPSPDRLFLNRDGKRFEDVPGYGLDAERGSFCAQAADVDDDGWTDLLLCGNEGMRLYRNEGGRKFVDVTKRYGVAGIVAGATQAPPDLSRQVLINNPQEPWRDAQLADLDGDGDPDLVAVGTKGVIEQKWDGGRFAAPKVIASMDAPYSLAVGDADADRRADVYVVGTCRPDGSQVTDRPDFLLSQSPTGKFRQARIDPVDGCGQSVSVLRDHGRDDFIVLNGRDRFVGLVQCLRFERS
jgi:hypothetical protein